GQAASPCARRHVSKRDPAGGECGEDRQARDAACAAAFVRDAFIGGGHGHPDGAGFAGAWERGNDADLYPCDAEAGGGSAESVGWDGTVMERGEWKWELEMANGHWQMAIGHFGEGGGAPGDGSAERRAA